MNAPLLELANWSVTYRNTIAAVRDVTLHVDQGQRLAIIGESGSGKSTLALSIAGLLPPDASTWGRLAWPGFEEPPKPGRDIGFVFQDPAGSLDPVMSIGAQIMEVCATHARMTRRQARARALELLHQVRLPDPPRMLRAYAHQLSGGQRQRAAIALAIAAGPRLLIADEATSALDTIVQAEIVALLDELTARNAMALLFITHDMALAASLAHEIFVMRDGAGVDYAPARDLIARPRSSYAASLIASHLDLETPARAHTSSAPPLLALAHVSKAFRRAGVRVPVLNDVSLHVGAGETLGLVGASGSGKTTLGRIALRLVEPDGGAIRFGGADLRALGQRALRKRRQAMQMVFQEPMAAFNPRASVADLLDDPLRIHGLAPRRERPAHIARLLERVGLSPQLASRAIHEISGGQRQRVAIARAIATRPKLIILDEPVSALDVSVRGRILDLLLQLQEEDGMAYLFISHDLGVVKAMAPRIAILDHGRIVETGATETILRDPQSPAGRALVAAVPRLHPAPA